MVYRDAEIDRKGLFCFIPTILTFPVTFVVLPPTSKKSIRSFQNVIGGGFYLNKNFCCHYFLFFVTKLINELSDERRSLAFPCAKPRKNSGFRPVSLKTKYSFRLQMSLEANYACIAHEKFKQILFLVFHLLAYLIIRVDN